MKNATIKTAAEILGVDEETFDGFPKNITDSIIAAIEMAEPDDEEKCALLHETLYDLWTEGCAYSDMKNIADETGADLDTLLSFDRQTQMNISFEYLSAFADSGAESAVKSVYDNIHRALQVRNIPDVADLLGKTAAELKKLPYEIQSQMCGAYLMEYEENGDNTQLKIELEKMLEELK